MASFDTAIVGGGIIGLATAWELLQRRPDMRLVVLEKEAQIAMHQSRHNSGVIHSGIYYRSGSLKAKTCVEGAKLMVEFCQAHRIPHVLCGKTIVATTPNELPALERLYQQGLANGVAGLSLMGPERLQELEPHARGVKALHVPSAGVVDFAQVAQVLADRLQAGGVHLRTSARVIRLRRDHGRWWLNTTAGTFEAMHLVTVAGLHSDRLAAMGGARRDLRIIPFRGEYYELVPERRSLIRALIYPVPRPELPFLGVHLTRAITGQVHAGPNAVLALKREGYRNTDVDLRDLADMLSFSGFWRLIARYGRIGLGEWYRSISKQAFVRALQRLVPEIRPEDLVTAGTGVRAQAVDARGRLLDDFDITQGEGATYVRNVPSPAATAAFSLGRTIASMVGRGLSAREISLTTR